MKNTYLVSFFLLSIIFSCKKDNDVSTEELLSPPSAPIELSAFDITNAAFKVKWANGEETQNISSYTVYLDADFFESTNDTVITITNLEPETTYEIYVTALNDDEVSSENSATIQVTTLSEADTDAPSMPEDLSASNTGVTSTELSWSPATDNIEVTGYKVYQGGNEIAQVTATNYSVTGLIGSTMYSFAVSAMDATGNESILSSAVSVTTDAPSDSESPTVPSGLISSNTTETSTELSWSAATDNVEVTGYKVYQGGNEITQVTDITYPVTGLNSSTTYSFTVSAVDAEGNESDQSSALEVTTETTSAKAKVLVFTKTSGFNHNTKSESEAMVQQIASSQDFDVVVDDDGSEFDSQSNLNQYEIIFFTNTSGNTLNQTQRDNVEAYAAQGGNFMSNHAASDSYGHSTASSVSGNGKGVWDWYSENVTGCSVRNSPNHTSSGFGATVTVQNQNSALTNAIGFPWSDNEEWYYWEEGYLDSSFTELLRVSDTGSNSYDDTRMTAHHWERPDGGVSFYSSMGHAKSKYSDSDFVQLMSNAFAFMLD